MDFRVQVGLGKHIETMQVILVSWISEFTCMEIVSRWRVRLDLKVQMDESGCESKSD